jgi:hypothetical protein
VIKSSRGARLPSSAPVKTSGRTKGPTSERRRLRNDSERRAASGPRSGPRPSVRKLRAVRAGRVATRDTSAQGAAARWPSPSEPS